VAIATISLITIGFSLDTKTVGDLASIKGSWPVFHLPNVPFDLNTLQVILPYSFILASVGLIESLLTLNLIDEMTETEGAPNRECFAQGIANVVTGFFGGMGGCAMIGQSMINVSSGATRRLSGIVAAGMLIAFVIFASKWIEMIPVAALVGVMVVVSEKTFEWGSIRALRKIPRHDAIVVVAVTAVTVMADLAVAVGVGVVISALVFAWQHAKHLDIRISIAEDGSKTYAVTGSLFFASVAEFSAAFTPRDESGHITIDFSRARVMDHSAIAAIDSIRNRYHQLGKQVTLLHVAPECRAKLERASTAYDNEAVFAVAA
jgi:SulP family sulfate permease